MGVVFWYTGYMVKTKKKRDKKYQGQEASKKHATVTHIQAVNRGKLGQWWYDNKRVAKPVLIASGVVGLLIVSILEIISIVNGG
jgi:hypothetical protein